MDEYWIIAVWLVYAKRVIRPTNGAVFGRRKPVVLNNYCVAMGLFMNLPVAPPVQNICFTRHGVCVR